MPIAVMSLLPYIAVALVALILAAWFYREYTRTEDVAEAAQRTGSAAGTAAAGSTRVAVLGFAGVGAAIAMQFFQLAAGLNEILGGAPVIVGHLLFGVLTMLGLKGVIPFNTQLAGFAFITVTVVALILRYGEGSGEGEAD